MGRGLSKLQRAILKIAAGKGEATYREILRRYFRWKVLPTGRVTISRYHVGGRSRPELRYADKRRWFDEEAIGPQRYARAIASLSRACTRLIARGLAKRPDRWQARREDRKKYGRRLLLTDAGMSAAQLLFNR
jgi:hypothetical protein